MRPLAATRLAATRLAATRLAATRLAATSLAATSWPKLAPVGLMLAPRCLKLAQVGLKLASRCFKLASSWLWNLKKPIKTNGFSTFFELPTVCFKWPQVGLKLPQVGLQLAQDRFKTKFRGNLEPPEPRKTSENTFFLQFFKVASSGLKLASSCVTLASN